MMLMRMKKLNFKKYKIFLLLFCVTVYFGLYSGEENKNPLGVAAALASLGSHGKFADKMRRNQENLLDALLKSAGYSDNDQNQVVINRYEAYTEQEISKKAFGAKDLKEQIVEDCKQAIDKWNSGNATEKIKSFVVDASKYDLQQDNTWRKTDAVFITKDGKRVLFSITHQVTDDDKWIIMSTLSICSSYRVTPVLYIPSDLDIESALETRISRDKWKILPEQVDPIKNEQKKAYFSVKNIMCFGALAILLIGILYYGKQKAIHA